MSKISLAEWQEHYYKLQASSLSIGAYAQQNGIPPSSMHSAITRLRKQGLIKSTKKNKPTFVQVTTDSTENTTSIAQMTSIKVSLPSGVEIQLTGEDCGDSAVGFICSLERSLREKL